MSRAQMYRHADGYYYDTPDGTDTVGKQLTSQDKLYYHDGKDGTPAGTSTNPTNPTSQAGSSFSLGGAIRGVTNSLGITNPAPPDLSKGPDTEKIRAFSDKLAAEYAGRTPGTAQTVTANPVTAATLDQTRANEARQTAENNIRGLEGVANGTTATAADALLQRGTDAARRNAAGLAAQYSRSDPGLALRAGLAAGNQAQAESTAVAAQQKATEQAQARGQIGGLADAMRGADLSASQYNANSANDIGKFNTTAGLTAATSNQGADLNQKNINNQFEIAKGNQVQTGLIAPLNAAQAAQQLQLENQKNNQQGLGALATGLGSAISDERAKTDVKPASLADALAETVHGVSYRYKPGKADGAAHVGVLAQDVEKVAPGIVKAGPGGLKRIDTDQATLMNTGVLAELAKRLKAVEARG